MLMARYYKKTWTSVKPLDKDLWFRLHQFFMYSAVVLTVIGIIIIVVDKGLAPFEGVNINPHPVFGLIAFLGALAQPIMAYFRPHPGTDYRWVFNWAHWFVGNATFIFAIVAIFFAMEYPAVKMPTEVVYVLITYVVIHIVVHVSLTIHRFYHERMGSSDKVKDLNDASEPSNEDAPGSDFRRAVAYVYLGLVWIFAFVILGWIIERRTHFFHDHDDHDHGQADPEAEAEG